MVGRYIVAVSGGIDSIVLLHQLIEAGDRELIVAHFDHGMRPDSSADSRFVQELALRYGLQFISRREELGPGASEDMARTRRYNFLRDVARWQNGTIVTAHHYDDVVETVAINLIRGTGWRGLAVLDSVDIHRPLLDLPKSSLIKYALKHRLEWVEDSTNQSDDYLRNRLRRTIGSQLDEVTKMGIWGLWRQQVQLKSDIESEIAIITPGRRHYERYQLIMSDTQSGSELLREIIARTGRQTPTRPQLVRALLAIKTAKPAAIHQVGSGVSLRFSKRSFTIETTS